MLHQDTAPIGNLVDEPLIESLDWLVREPAFEAISTGHPERMGLAYGWSIEDFLARSRTRKPGGKLYANLCIGCDAFPRGDAFRCGTGGATAVARAIDHRPQRREGLNESSLLVTEADG